MPYTYLGEPFSGTAPYSGQVAVDTIRFLVGDTDSSDWQLLDGEITGLFNNNNSDVYQSAVEACLALAAKYARQVDKSIGDASVDAAERAQHYRDLAKDLRWQAIRHGSAPKPYAGGLYEDDVEANRDDDSIVQPQFAVAMHDEPDISSVDTLTGGGFTQVVPG